MICSRSVDCAGRKWGEGGRLAGVEGEGCGLGWGSGVGGMIPDSGSRRVTPATALVSHLYL